MGYVVSGSRTEGGRERTILTGTGKDAGKTRVIYGDKGDPSVNKPRSSGGSISYDLAQQLHETSVKEKLAEQQKQEQQKQEQQEVTEYYVTHEETGRKIPISVGLANKIAYDRLKYNAENPKGSYPQFRALLEDRQPKQSNTTKFIKGVDQAQDFTSTYLFGRDPELVNIGGEVYKYDRNMRVNIKGQDYTAEVSKVGMFDFGEAKRYATTKTGKGEIATPIFTKYDPKSEFVRSGVRWEMDKPFIAGATYGVGAVFGASMSGGELIATKIATKFPKLTKFSGAGNLLVAGGLGSMIGLAGLESGKSIYGSSNRVRTAGEETAKWLTFGAGAKLGGDLINPRLEIARAKLDKKLNLGFSKDSKLTYTQKQEIKAIDDYQAFLDKKAYTKEGVYWEKTIKTGFKENTPSFQSQLTFSDTKPIKKYSGNEIIDTAFQSARDIQIKEAIRLFEAEFRPIDAKQKNIQDFTNQFGKLAVDTTPKNNVLGVVDKPVFIQQPKLNSFFNIGKKGSIYVSPQLIQRDSVFKFGSPSGIKPKSFNTFMELGKNYNINVNTPKSNIFYGLDIFGGGSKIKPPRIFSETKGRSKENYDLLEVSELKYPEPISVFNDFEYKFKDFYDEDYFKDRDYKEREKLGYFSFNDQFQDQKQETKQALRLDLDLGFKSFKTIRPIPEPKFPDLFREEKRARKPFKPIVEIPQFTPRAFSVRSGGKSGFKIKPLDLDIFPVSDLFSATLTELKTGKRATQRKSSKKAKKDFWEFIRSGSQIFPTKEIYTGKVKIGRLNL